MTMPMQSTRARATVVEGEYGVRHEEGALADSEHSLHVGVATGDWDVVEAIDAPCDSSDAAPLGHLAQGVVRHPERLRVTGSDIPVLLGRALVEVRLGLGGHKGPFTRR